MRKSLLAALLIATSAPAALAHGITSEVDQTKTPAFDITSAAATTDGRLTTFMMEVAGVAGGVKPIPIGQLAGAKVEAYVWRPSVVAAAEVISKADVLSGSVWLSMLWASAPRTPTTKRMAVKMAYFIDHSFRIESILSS